MKDAPPSEEYLCAIEGYTDSTLAKEDPIVVDALLRLVAEVRRLDVVLKSVEWSGEVQTHSACPSCGAPGPDAVVDPRSKVRAGYHREVCVLGSAIAGRSRPAGA